MHCIEPNTEMRATLSKNLAGSIAAGKVVVIEGSAEQTNLPEGVKPQLFIGGDMAHWVEKQGQAIHELKEKLKPDGKVAFIVRYPDGDSPIVKKLHELLELHSRVYALENANKLCESAARLAAKQGRHLIEDDGKIIQEPLFQVRSKEEIFHYLQSRSSTTIYSKPPRIDGDSDAAHEKHLAASKTKVYTEVINPLFEFARENGLIAFEDEVEKIPLPRVMHIMIGIPRECKKTEKLEASIRQI